jgi:hypothetical protein
LDYFPFGNDLIIGVKVDVHYFKIMPLNIVNQPFSNIHKDKIKKRTPKIQSYSATKVEEMGGYS